MFTVYDKDLNVKTLPHGVSALDIYVSSINKRRVLNDIDGVHGHVDMGYMYDTREVVATVKIESYGTRDYRKNRSRAYAFFADEYFYIEENDNPGAFYKVAFSDSVTPERLSKDFAVLEFPLEMSGLPFGESDTTSVAFGTKSFRITNEGDIPIHPFSQELKITISNVVGGLPNFELKNITNGDTFIVTDAINASQVVVINGPTVTIGGLQQLRKTNRKFIQLEKGWNDFEIKNATSAKVTFEYKNYYL